jgi:hypothetical protein
LDRWSFGFVEKRNQPATHRPVIESEVIVWNRKTLEFVPGQTELGELANKSTWRATKFRVLVAGRPVIVRETIIMVAGMDRSHGQQMLEDMAGQIAPAQLLTSPLLQWHLMQS